MLANTGDVIHRTSYVKKNQYEKYTFPPNVVICLALMFSPMDNSHSFGGL